MDVLPGAAVARFKLVIFIFPKFEFIGRYGRTAVGFANFCIVNGVGESAILVLYRLEESSLSTLSLNFLLKRNSAFIAYIVLSKFHWSYTL